MVRIAWFVVAPGVEVAVGLALWKWQVMADSIFYPLFAIVVLITVLATLAGIFGWWRIRHGPTETILLRPDGHEDQLRPDGHAAQTYPLYQIEDSYLSVDETTDETEQPVLKSVRSWAKLKNVKRLDNH